MKNILKGFLPLLGIVCSIVTYANEKDLPLVDDSVAMSYNIDEVVIVAFKGRSDLSVQPVSATRLSGVMMKERNIHTLKDLNAFVPNFFMPEYGSKLTSPVYVRGIGSRINAPSVGLYVDGIPYFDRSSFDFLSAGHREHRSAAGSSRHPVRTEYHGRDHQCIYEISFP